jgi:hypothetical protein
VKNSWNKWTFGWIQGSFHQKEMLTSHHAFVALVDHFQLLDYEWTAGIPVLAE